MSESFGDYIKRTWILWAISITAMASGFAKSWIGYPLAFASGVLINIVSKRLTR